MTPEKLLTRLIDFMVLPMVLTWDSPSKAVRIAGTIAAFFWFILMAALAGPIIGVLMVLLLWSQLAGEVLGIIKR
jgi:hypothetical protein